MVDDPLDLIWSKPKCWDWAYRFGCYFPQDLDPQNILARYSRKKLQFIGQDHSNSNNTNIHTTVDIKSIPLIARNNCKGSSSRINYSRAENVPFCLQSADLSRYKTWLWVWSKAATKGSKFTSLNLIYLHTFQNLRVECDLLLILNTWDNR